MSPSRLALTTLAITLLLPVTAIPQDVTEPALKATFIYSFMRFTEWPDPVPASDPVVICVLGDSAVGDALERVIKGRELAGRRMTVALLAFSGPMKTCRVLYVSGLTAGQRAPLLAGLHGSPVLTISDAAGFIEAGGMAQIFFERGQTRFNIGLPAVKRSRLQMSSKLLSLANRHE
jgi:hypothetical protein